MWKQALLHLLAISTHTDTNTHAHTEPHTNTHLSVNEPQRALGSSWGNRRAPSHWRAAQTKTVDCCCCQPYFYSVLVKMIGRSFFFYSFIFKQSFIRVYLTHGSPNFFLYILVKCGKFYNVQSLIRSVEVVTTVRELLPTLESFLLCTIILLGLLVEHRTQSSLCFL